MPFELVSPQRIYHSSGYTVQGRDRYHLEYIENNRVLIIPVEDRAENNYEIYWDKILGWESPFENYFISDDKLEEIKRNLKSALKFHDI